MRSGAGSMVLLGAVAWLLAGDRVLAAPPLLPARTRPSIPKPMPSPAVPSDMPTAGSARPKSNSAKGPYEAVVLEDDVTVRCGPGRKYYPTSKLRAGDRVKVVRHDPGGWFVIEPPDGSFSWVPARAIDKQPDGRGVVTVSQVAVRVGSYESDIRDMESRRLRKGESVRIQGEKVLAEENGQRELWYRIAPPKYEWRWVLGQFVVPTDQLPGSPVPNPGATLAKATSESASIERSASSDPFLDIESRHEKILLAGAEADDLPRPPAKGIRDSSDELQTPRDPVSLEAPPANENASADEETPREDTPVPPIPAGSLPVDLSRREGALTPDVAEAELRRLDAKLRTIVEEECVLWEFTGVKAEFESLLTENPPEESVDHIRARLAQIQTWERKRDNVLELRRMALLVERRDRELAEKLKSGTPKQNPAPDSPSTPPLDKPAPPTPTTESPTTESPTTESPTTGKLPATSPSQPPPTAAQPEHPIDGRVLFVGAGLVELAPAQRPANTPAYRLITPQGRFLAWLQPDTGFDLSKWVGKPAGLLGRRQFDARLQADLIEVKGASPVRLSNGPPTRLTPPVR